VTAALWGLHPSVVPFLACVALGAGFVQATAGFGFALLAVPLMALVVPPQTAVVTVFLLGAVSSVLTAFFHHGHIDRTETWRLSTGAIVAMPLGALILVTASAGVLRIALGVATCSAAVWMLLPRTRRRAPAVVRPATTYSVGAMSGVLNTALTTSGPPLVVYLRARGLSTDPFRATISAVFTITNLVGLMILALSGAIHRPAVAAFVLTVVPALIGWGAGNAVAGRLHNRHFIRLVDVILLVSGLLSIGRAVLG
jgi:uncharacterized membrane protein YfcA